MDQLMELKNFNEYKEQLDNAMHQAADAFVRIGYLLRVAKDTDILSESKYENINDMAKAEYGLSPDQVSRYMAINERFSENGYGQQLRKDMQGYGIGKLQIMLTLSDEVVKTIPPEVTKSELQEIQKEIKVENQKSDLEVMMEGHEQEEKSLLYAFVKQYFHDNTDQYEIAYALLLGESSDENMLDAIAPGGVAMLRTRIRGIGVLMLSICGADIPIKLINVRTNEQECYELRDMAAAFEEIFIDTTMKAKDMWREVFEEDWPEEVEPPKKEEIAPVQHREEPKVEESGSKTEENIENTEVRTTDDVNSVDNPSENEEKCVEIVENTEVEEHLEVPKMSKTRERIKNLFEGTPVEPEQVEAKPVETWSPAEKEDEVSELAKEWVPDEKPQEEVIDVGEQAQPWKPLPDVKSGTEKKLNEQVEKLLRYIKFRSPSLVQTQLRMIAETVDELKGEWDA